MTLTPVRFQQNTATTRHYCVPAFSGVTEQSPTAFLSNVHGWITTKNHAALQNALAHETGKALLRQIPQAQAHQLISIALDQLKWGQYTDTNNNALNNVLALIENGLPLSSTKINDVLIQVCRRNPFDKTLHTIQVNIVNALLSRDADPNTGESRRGDTPLILAIEAENDAVVEALLRDRVNKQRPNNFGVTPLNMAAYKRNITIASLLFTSPGQIDNRNLIDSEGQTALDIAISQNDSAMIQLLKQYHCKTAAEVLQATR